MPSEEFVSLAELESIDNQELLEGFNPEADANASVPPLPKGDYLCKIYHQAEDATQYWMKKIAKSGTSYLASQLTLEVAENAANPKEYWGRKIFPAYYAMTLVMKNTGTTNVQAVLQGIGKGEVLKNIPRTKEKQAAALTKELNSKPLSVVSLDWQCAPYDKEKDETLFTVRGMSRFTKRADGTYDPEYNSKEHGTFMAQNYVIRFSDPRTYKAKGKAGTAAAGASDKQDAPPATTIPTTRPQPKPQSTTAPAPAQTAGATK